MKNVEKIIVCLALLGFILKLLHIPGGAILSVFSFLSLSLFYIISGFTFFNSEAFAGTVNSTRFFGSIGAGLSLFITLIGILFRLMHWPGAAVMLLNGIFCSLIILVICLIKYADNRSIYYKHIGLRIGIIDAVAVILFFM